MEYPDVTISQQAWQMRDGTPLSISIEQRLLLINNDIDAFGMLIFSYF